MLPSATIEDMTMEKKASDRAFEIDFENKKIGKIITGKKAVGQAIHLALMTPRYKYAIFSHSFGTDFDGVFASDYVKAMGKVKNAICDSLSGDERIRATEDFEFERKGGKMIVKFRAVTDTGNIDVTEVVGNGFYV